MLDRALREAPKGMPTPGEDAARRRFRSFLERDLDDYADGRDDPGADRTSRLSAYLKLGVLHPRQILTETSGSRSSGARTFVSERTRIRASASLTAHCCVGGTQSI